MKLKQLLVFAFCAPTLQLVAQKHQIGLQSGTGLGNYIRSTQLDDSKIRENLDSRLTYNFVFKRKFVIGSGFGFFQEITRTPYFAFADSYNQTNGFQYEKFKYKRSAISLPISFGYRTEFMIKTRSLYFSGNGELLFVNYIRSQITRSAAYSDGTTNPNAGITANKVNDLVLMPRINVQVGFVLNEKFDAYVGYGFGFGEIFRSKLQGKFYGNKFFTNSFFFGIRYTI